MLDIESLSLFDPLLQFKLANLVLPNTVILE
jgi:hypothetical protein